MNVAALSTAAQDEHRQLSFSPRHLHLGCVSTRTERLTMVAKLQTLLMPENRVLAGHNCYCQEDGQDFTTNANAWTTTCCTKDVTGCSGLEVAGVEYVVEGELYVRLHQVCLFLEEVILFNASLLCRHE